LTHRVFLLLQLLDLFGSIGTWKSRRGCMTRTTEYKPGGVFMTVE